MLQYAKCNVILAKKEAGQVTQSRNPAMVTAAESGGTPIIHEVERQDEQRHQHGVASPATTPAPASPQ
jgi:hypothetical protein